MMLDLRNIYKTYAQGKLEVPVLKNVSLSVEEGEYVAIMGPSGSGKTTLMNIIGCLDNPTSGEYLLEGEDLSQQNDASLSLVRLHSIGFVFQSFYLLSRQSAVENVALPLLYAGVRRRERLETARKALERVGLGDRTDFKPTQLSGGQCQRVAIARAIVNNPKILLADEPTGALDTKSGEQIMEIFQKLNEEGVTIVMITHEPEIAAHAQRILHIRDGRLTDDQGNFLSPEETIPEETIPEEDPALEPSSKEAAEGAALEDPKADGAVSERHEEEQAESADEEKISPAEEDFLTAEEFFAGTATNKARDEIPAEENEPKQAESPVEEAAGSGPVQDETPAKESEPQQAEPSAEKAAENDRPDEKAPSETAASEAAADTAFVFLKSSTDVSEEGAENAPAIAEKAEEDESVEEPEETAPETEASLPETTLAEEGEPEKAPIVEEPFSDAFLDAEIAAFLDGTEDPAEMPASSEPEAPRLISRAVKEDAAEQLSFDIWAEPESQPEETVKETEAEISAPELGNEPETEPPMEGQEVFSDALPLPFDTAFDAVDPYEPATGQFGSPAKVDVDLFDAFGPGMEPRQNGDPGSGDFTSPIKTELNGLGLSAGDASPRKEDNQ